MHKGFSARKTLGKRLIHCQNDWSGHGLAGQFGLMESGLSLGSGLSQILLLNFKLSSRAVTPRHLQLLRTDRKGIIDDVIMHGT